MKKPAIQPAYRAVDDIPARAFEKTGKDRLKERYIIPLTGYGPEDIVADKNGKLICGVKGGDIIRIDPETKQQAVIGNTGGWPGLEAHFLQEMC